MDFNPSHAADPPEEGMWIPGLQTFVKKITYDVVLHVGVIYMPGWCCTDMRGAIEFFKRIDRNVQLIECIAEERPRYGYVRHGEEWACYEAACPAS